MDQVDIIRLANAIREILPEDVALVVDSLVKNREKDVFEEEAAQMVRAVPKRRVEFFAGRAAAHQAMRVLGVCPAPVLMGKDRAPIWPVGLVGSISHCSETCVALVARTANYRSLAVDIEPDADLSGEVVESVLSSTELNRLTRLPEKDRGRLARLIFSAKETVFKLQYPFAKKMLEFNDVEIIVDPAENCFEAHFAVAQQLNVSTRVLAGRYRRVEGKIVCIMFAR